MNKEDNHDNFPELNFEKNIHVDELGSDKESNDDDLPLDLMKLIELEKKPIEPHQEETETVNLGDEENKKEVKIGVTLPKQELVRLLHEYVDVFAWSYQDMPGLSSEIAEH